MDGLRVTELDANMLRFCGYAIGFACIMVGGALNPFHGNPYRIHQQVYLAALLITASLIVFMFMALAGAMSFIIQ